jgi:hypothetical protein
LKKDGTGSFTRRTVGAGRDSAAVLYTLALLDGLPTMVRGEGPGRAVITFRGDTAVATATLGGLLIRTTWVPEGGAFKVTQAKTEAAGGKARGGAVYTFGADGSGAGVDTRIGTEGKARDGAVRFRADGSIYYDGVKVPR